ncbi:MAG: hypothetical protein ACRDRA_17000 [Pseudonocardiaceae bacterium]
MDQPGWERFGLTVRPAQQWVWLDCPDGDTRWTLTHRGDKPNRGCGNSSYSLVNQRMFVVGHTAGGVPFGCYEDEFEDLP